jgi:hypothetical protein
MPANWTKRKATLPNFKQSATISNHQPDQLELKWGISIS